MYIRLAKKGQHSTWVSIRVAHVSVDMPFFQIPGVRRFLTQVFRLSEVDDEVVTVGDQRRRHFDISRLTPTDLCPYEVDPTHQSTRASPPKLAERKSRSSPSLSLPHVSKNVLLLPRSAHRACWSIPSSRWTCHWGPCPVGPRHLDSNRLLSPERMRLPA